MPVLLFIFAIIAIFIMIGVSDGDWWGCGSLVIAFLIMAIAAFLMGGFS